MTRFMFQYNPTNYDLEASVQRSLIEDWQVPQHREKLRVGQRIYFMRSKAGQQKEERRFTAVGRLATLPYTRPHPRTNEPYWLADVVYDYLVQPNFDKTAIENDADPDFNSFKPYVVGLYNTVFPLPPRVAERTEQVLRPLLRAIGTSQRVVDKRVFVSHSHQDNEFSLRLVNDLRKALGGQDETVWFDVSGGLEPGDTFINTIREEIRDRPVFLLIVSADAMRSRFVQHELDLALTYDLNSPGGKLIVPILYRDKLMRTDLSMRQAVSFLPPREYEDALADLVDKVSQVR